jgi:hypothetical protein
MLTAKGSRNQEAHGSAYGNAGSVLRTPGSMTDEQLFSQSVKDVYFDYDKSDIRGDQQGSVQGTRSSQSAREC